MAYIFHIIEREVWNDIKKKGESYSPATLKSDGFIHCSKADQILDVANHLYKGREHGHLILLKIFEPKIVPEVKHEPPYEFPMSEIFYPHVYGPLNLDSVEKEIDLPMDEAGNYLLPKLL